MKESYLRINPSSSPAPPLREGEQGCGRAAAMAAFGLDGDIMTDDEEVLLSDEFRMMSFKVGGRSGVPAPQRRVQDDELQGRLGHPSAAAVGWGEPTVGCRAV